MRFALKAAVAAIAVLILIRPFPGAAASSNQTNPSPPR